MQHATLDTEQLLEFLKQTFAQTADQTVALTKLADSLRELTSHTATRDQLVDIRGAIGDCVTMVTKLAASVDAQHTIVKSMLESTEKDKQHHRDLERLQVEDVAKKRRESLALVAKIAGWVLMGGGVTALLVERLLS